MAELAAPPTPGQPLKWPLLRPRIIGANGLNALSRPLPFIQLPFLSNRCLVVVVVVLIGEGLEGPVHSPGSVEEAPVAAALGQNSATVYVKSRIDSPNLSPVFKELHLPVLESESPGHGGGDGGHGCDPHEEGQEDEEGGDRRRGQHHPLQK